MLWRGISIEPEWVVLALLVIAIAMGRGLVFIADWGPFLLLFFAYEAMRGFASKTGFAPHDLSDLERAVFAGTLPTVTMQHAFYRVDSISPQDVIAMFFYFMHFPLPILVGFVFWLRSRDHYHRFIAALLLMAFLAFVTYLFWPSAPPWYQFKLGVAPEGVAVHKILNETVDKIWGNNYIVSPLYTHLNPNQFAAFPSLHAAFPADARGRACPMDARGAGIHCLPRRALRRRRTRRISLCRCGDRARGRVHALARPTTVGYACQTFRMMVRANLSGSWCEGLRTLTTSEAMKRTSVCRAASVGLKITGA